MKKKFIVTYIAIQDGELMDLDHKVCETRFEADNQLRNWFMDQLTSARAADYEVTELYTDKDNAFFGATLENACLNTYIRVQAFDGEASDIAAMAEAPTVNGEAPAPKIDPDDVLCELMKVAKGMSGGMMRYTCRIRRNGNIEALNFDGTWSFVCKCEDHPQDWINEKLYQGWK